MKLSDLKFKFFGDNSIIITEKGFEPDYKKEERHMRALIDNINGFVAELRLDTKSYREYDVIENVYVVTSKRGKGYATELYQKALEHAKRRGKKGIASSPLTRRPAMENFWRKYGQEFDEENDLDIITRDII